MRAKKMAAMAAMAAMTAAAVPAYAQDQAAPSTQQGVGSAQYEAVDQGQPGPRIVTATGVLGEPYTPGQDPTPVYDLTDEATGTTYTLFDISAGLDAFVGQRITVEGSRSPGINPLNLDVTSVVTAGGAVEGEEITATFELAVECDPPQGTTFFAGASQQTAGLTDPDGDGLYTGSLTLPEGFYDLGAFEVPVAILSGTPEIPNQQTIKYFGEMVLEDGDAFSASVSFCNDGDGNGGNSGGSGNGGSGGTDDGNGSAVVSGDTSNADKGGSGSVGASVGAVKGGASSVAQGSASPIASVLPATGGVLPVAGATGVMLIVGGLVARKVFR